VPELPDVEMFRDYFNATALHQKVAKVSVSDDRVLEDTSARKLARSLKGKEFSSTRRYGKNLLADVEGSCVLRLHFGMTGNLKYYKDEDEDEELEHVRVLVDFENSYKLAYICQRMLGNVSVEESVEDFVRRKELGPDAMEISADELAEKLAGTRQSVKAFFMDQEKIAGLGNIYTDEVLFQCGIHPGKSCAKLDEKEAKELHKTIHRVVDYAVKHRADPRKFGGNYLLPRRGEGEPCPRCGGKIKKMKVSGRSAYFCPKCQKK